MAVKEYRKMKVYEQSGYRYKSTPTIMLKGQWLKELGFESGDKIQVKCEEEKLIITKAEGTVIALPEIETIAAMKVAEPDGVYGRRCR